MKHWYVSFGVMDIIALLPKSWANIERSLLFYIYYWLQYIVVGPNCPTNGTVLQDVEFVTNLE